MSKKKSHGRYDRKGLTIIELFEMFPDNETAEGKKIKIEPVTSSSRAWLPMHRLPVVGNMFAGKSAYGGKHTRGIVSNLTSVVAFNPEGLKFMRVQA